jgi:hypothetical protein
MMSRKSLYIAKAWLKNLFSLKAATAWLSAFGALWLLVEITTFFFQNVLLFGTMKLPDYIRSLWPLFFAAGLGLAVFATKPRLSICGKLNGRDIFVRIVIGDLLLVPGAIVIGSNTTFDTRISSTLISERSVQGLFTHRYYGDQRQIQAELADELKGLPSTPLTGRREGNSLRYEIGSCAALHPKGRTAYFLAIADVNEHGVCSAKFEDLKECLAKLWVFIGNRGSKEPVAMPILGTGFGRLPQTRTEVIHEIIQSFVAACSEKTFCEDLTIVIRPADIEKYSISLDELEAFLHHECKYTAFSIGNRSPLGTAA